MKFEESSLTRYLVKNLQPLTEADPVILSEYVAALLKKDKPVKELQKLCSEKLVEFLGQATDSFIAKLFKTLEDGSVVESAKSLDATGPVELSASLITVDPVELKSSTLNPEVPSCESDPDEKEVSDDDDDDRNHKHKRREARSQSFDKNVQGNSLRRTNRKHNKPFENGQVFFGNDPQSSENQREYTPALGRDFYARIDKRRPGFTSLPRTAHDLGLRTRVNQTFHGDPGPHFDLSTSMGRFSVGRGRGRGSTSWNPHDLNFNANETFDFASQMPSHGPPPTSLFASRGLPQFGMIPGMANGGLDTLHPIGLQGALGPQINQPMNIGMLRQRCRDFEERGFCLRGDMCPMEHGVNRIVVEDVQSLSQFNLPVSLPSAHLQGTTPGAGPLHLGVDSSSLEAHTKLLHNKNNTHGIGDNGFGLNKVSSASAGAGEADLYDPDQPLWNNHSSPKVDDTETLWNGDASDRRGLRASDGFDGEQPGRSISSALGSQSTSSSVWGRIGNSGNKLETAGKFDTNVPSTSFLGNAMKDKEKALSSVPGTSHKRKQFSSEDADPKATIPAANPRLLGEAARNNGRNSQKALRTVFVNGIPQKNNKRESLLSHFRKFGQVVDIYIPLNSEKAFVQFSKREEAEAALKAPDAVMGNRFIKLWWANRDSIPDSSLNIGDTVSAAPKDVAASVLSQPSIVDRRKESHSSAVPKVSAAPLADLPMSTAVVSPSGTNVPKVALSSQKKMDTLEVLKEELRIKQEMLDKKRNEFRRQLNMLEKKAVTIKGETTAEQLAKRHKTEVASPAKTAAPNPSNSIAAGTCPRSEKVGVKSHSRESIESPSSKVKSSPKSLKHPNHLSATLGTVCVANRFKLDNRPTAFRILPPLPADFANVAMLKEHFSKYGDISAVELEDLGPDSGVACSEPSGNCAARITFTARRSAEMAFLNGKCWRDQSLKFSWVVGHNNSVNSHSGRENSSTPTPKGTPDAEVLVEIAPLKSLAATSESISSISQDPAPSGNEEHGNPEEIKDANEPMQSLESCHSSGNPLSSCHSSLKVDTLIVEDGIDAENVL